MSSNAHNDLVRQFVFLVGRNCTSSGELMVVLESILVGSMDLNVRLFGLKPQVASGLVEDAVHQALIRFTKESG